MKKSILPRHEIAEDDGFHQYLLDRPGLLLKMLDLAETWQERKRPSAQASAATNTGFPPAKAATRLHVRSRHERQTLLTLKSS